MTTAFQANAFQWNSFQIELVLEVPAGALTFVGQTGYAIQDTPLTPATGSLSLTGQTPEILATASVWLTPDAGALSFSGQVPLSSEGTVLQPGTGALTLTGAIPARTVSDNRLFIPGTAALRLSGKAPSIGGAERRRRPIYIIDPLGMSMRDWCDSMVMQLEPNSHCGRLDDDNWQRWAAWFTTAPNLSQNHAPNPYLFSDWREWAKSFNNAMSPAGF